ncbi:polyprenyl synthetase family protein [Actinosynnema sp. NPDC020468]|uniref:polyprenyl synthetase family protein n=1 Tax=Actinosynnema sp. NPDC020468 TaxID=3154488 RepID=UPI0033D30469
MNTPLLRERDTPAVLDDARSRIKPVLRGAVDSLPPTMRLVTDYHFGWRDRDGLPVPGDPWSGKAMRPALVLLAAAAVTDPALEPRTDGAVLRAAVAVELVHNFSLVHDDVMDNDALRRHRETVWKVFGVPAAILAGDALLALANQVLTDDATAVAPAAVTMLNEAVQELIEGQSLDVSFEVRGEVALEECAAMADKKTAALMACACGLGALLAGGSPEQVRLLRQFGTHLGLAFQLADDLLGLRGDPRRTGKPANNDLWTRKKSLPVVAALTSDTDAGRELAALYARTEPWEHADVERALVLVEEAGGVAWARDEAARRVEQALAGLREAGARPDAAADLAGLLRLSARRDH